MSDEIDEDVVAMRRSLSIKSPDVPALFLSTGCTLLNLAISGTLDGGWRSGTCNLLVGDSNSAKTFISLTGMAEAAKDKRFDNYRLIYDNSERGALMNLSKYFGMKMFNRLEPPQRDKLGQPVYSRTLEDFYYNFDDISKAGKPCIYVMDSIDALESEEDIEAFQSNKKAARKGEEAAGTYGTKRARINSTNLRSVAANLERTNSFMVLVSQARDAIKIGPFSYGPEKTRAGGRALRFYSRIEFWTAPKKGIYRSDLRIGTWVEAEFKKNHITGWENKVQFPVYRSHGIDDLGACVGFLISSKAWDKTQKGVVTTKGLPRNVSTTEEKLIQHIEKAGLTQQVRVLVKQVWDQIEQKTRVIRNPRYE